MLKHLNITWLPAGLFILAIIVASTVSVESKSPEVSFDGLELVKSKKVAVLYTKPDADFSQYNKVILLDAYVAFKKNWQRDTKVAGHRVSNKDMTKIKADVAELFAETFTERLEKDGGYPIVKEADHNVLIFRPAIIDLDITAPDIKTPGRSNTYVASAGAATLYLELYDSVSGEILARVIDRRNMRDYGHMRWANSVTNRQDAKQMFARWADLLREGMDVVNKQ